MELTTKSVSDSDERVRKLEKLSGVDVSIIETYLTAMMADNEEEFERILKFKTNIGKEFGVWVENMSNKYNLNYVPEALILMISVYQNTALNIVENMKGVLNGEDE